MTGENFGPIGFCRAQHKITPQTLESQNTLGAELGISSAWFHLQSNPMYASMEPSCSFGKQGRPPRVSPTDNFKPRSYSLR